MNNIQLLLLIGAGSYLLYMYNEKSGNQVETPQHIQVDITRDIKPVKEHVPIIADEKPIPPKPIAIPTPNIPLNRGVPMSIPRSTPFFAPNYQKDQTPHEYFTKHGWVGYDLFNRLHQPDLFTYKF